ncbi:MAG TPA: FtsX-like permease family protein [Gaiellaceae bacterium]|jgi:putative ABC transport system permease protein
MRHPRSLSAPWLLAVRRLPADASLAAAVFAVVAVTSFLFAAAPRAFNRIADDGLRFAVGHASPYERNVEIDRVARIDPGTGDRPLSQVEAAGARYERGFPASIRGVIGAPRAAVETVRFTVVNAPGVSGPPGTVRLLNVAFLTDARRHVRIAGGRLPTGRAAEVPIPFRGEQRTATRLEVALSSEAARQLSLAAGARVYLAPDPQDTLVRDVPLSEHRFIVVDVTGIIAPRTPADAGWLKDSRLGRAVVRDTETQRFIYAYALFAPDAYGAVADAVEPFPLRYAWRYDVDASGFDAGEFDRFQADVRRLDAEFGQTTYGQTAGVGVRTGLSAVLGRFERDRDAAEAVLAIATAALLAVALAVAALLTALAAARRGETVGLLRSRGGSIAQVLAAEGVQGFLVAAPAGALGFLAALLTGGRASALSLWLVLAVVLATALMFAAAALVPARRPPAVRIREEAAVARLLPRRAAGEALVLLLSILGVYLLRRRGVAGESGFDPYLATVPLLLGLAAGLLAVRLYPFAVGALALAAGRRRDLVPSLGFQHAARQPAVTAAPLLVVLLSVSVAVFAATMATTLAHAQAGAAAELSPLATGSVRAFRVAVAVASAYAAVALLLTPVLTAAARLRDVAYLRALGLSRRQGLGLTTVELGPPMGAALLLGIIVGLAAAYVSKPGLDLESLAGGGRVAIRLDPLAPILLVLGLALVLAVALAALGVAERRTSLARILRMGER